MQKKYKKMQKYLRMSKKSSTFAPAFRKKAIISVKHQKLFSRRSAKERWVSG